MTWVHERPGWPDYTWDDTAVGALLADVRHKQGRHLGNLEGLGFDLRTEARVSVLTNEVVRSSAIAELALAQADGTQERYYSISSAIEAQREQYFRRLEAAQRGSLDISIWLTWFLACLDRSIREAVNQLTSVLFKARLWQRTNQWPGNDRQCAIINLLLGDFYGHLTTSKYARLAKCSTNAALRDIRELLARGVIARNPGGGRSTSYRLAAEEPRISVPVRSSVGGQT